jgi:hypothetical protein
MYSSEDEIERVVRGFETCETDKAAFKHREHLTVAVWYLETCDTKAAVQRMRTGLLRFLDHHGVARTKYSEEITVCWIELIAEKLGELTPNTLLVDKCNYVIKNTDKTDFNQPAHTPASQVANEVSPAKS